MQTIIIQKDKFNHLGTARTITCKSVLTSLLLLIVSLRMHKPATLLLHLYSICTVAATTTGTSIDNLNTTFSSSDYQFFQLLCSSDLNIGRGHGYVDCSQNEPLLTPGSCATFDEDRGVLSLFSCSDFQPNVSISESIKLPRNVSHLNDIVCGLLNRNGLVCSECADGFGPSITSLGYRCIKCTDTWYRVPLFLFPEFVPVTVFYLIVLVFQIRITLAPMPCFIMCTQLAVICLKSFPFAFADTWKLKLDVKVMVTLYGLFILNFSHNNILPPYCVSSKLKPIHLGLINYISVFYPILLIFLTWVCVELHGRNFRPLVWLWRPFHRCFVQLRRGWDTKSDIIDVFITFSFFLMISFYFRQ